MMTTSNSEIHQRFYEEVSIKFQLYNSLFISLPFHKIEKTGLYLSLFSQNAEEGLQNGQSAPELVSRFLEENLDMKNQEEKFDLLFNFIKYAERQVVLFDAIEDAAFTSLHDVDGQGSLKSIYSQSSALDANKIKDFAIRLVLTAHPTQFYPGSVLGIINDLTAELKNNNTRAVNQLLSQLGRTPFIKKQKPTPFDEAVSLIWYLENVFYEAIGQMVEKHKNQLPFLTASQLVHMGFWPGGDRDGNPFVDATTTLAVADALKTAILRCYYRDIRKLKRRLTFSGLEPILNQLEGDLNAHAYGGQKDIIRSTKDIVRPLLTIKSILLDKYDGLFVEEVDQLLHKVNYFGVHFAFIDIRQENEIHRSLFEHLSENHASFTGYSRLTNKQKLIFLGQCQARLKPSDVTNPVHKDVILSMQAMKKIQRANGPNSCHRYIISQCASVYDVMEVYALLRMCSWHESTIPIDIVPLFETIDDLVSAPNVIASLFRLKEYKAHLSQRKNTQMVMLGFSDGTKDGGYLAANHAIYKAKKELTAVGRNLGIEMIFFDGRGGPPGRGGGKTHKFYASQGPAISSKEIQLTIQGQTISSNFGNKEAARYNVEQLITAGLSNFMADKEKKYLSASDDKMLAEMAAISLEKYLSLKNHNEFMNYITTISPLRFFGETNIGSRPAKRGKTEKLTLKDLRAIPFVASWNMIKQNIAGFYGLGTALQAMDKKNKLEAVKAMYRRSLFFRTLIDNSEMALLKSNFQLTSHLSLDGDFKNIWDNLRNEYELSKQYIFKISGKSKLMEDYPLDRLSVEMRERIVIPLTAIQQYALDQLRKSEVDDHTKKILEHLVVRASFGIINAGRNSA